MVPLFSPAKYLISSMTVPTWGLVCWWDGGGLVLWLFVRTIGVCLLDFFCSGVQFYLLLGPCLCFALRMGRRLGVFHADRISMCLGPHLELGLSWRQFGPSSWKFY